MRRQVENAAALKEAESRGWELAHPCPHNHPAAVTRQPSSADKHHVLAQDIYSLYVTTFSSVKWIENTHPTSIFLMIKSKSNQMPSTKERTYKR